MNYVAFGRARDEKVIELIEAGTAFTRSQIERIIFKQKDGKRKAQLRLQKLSSEGRIDKLIRSPHEPAIYSIGKISKRTIDHCLIINEVYCAILSQKKSFYTVKWKWSYPLMGGKLWADAILEVYDKLSKRRHVIFIEVERYADKRFEKDAKYAAIASMNWIKEEWAITEPTRILFPAILIVTETDLKVKSNLDFFVANMTQVKKDIYSVILRR